MDIDAMIVLDPGGAREKFIRDSCTSSIMEESFLVSKKCGLYDEDGNKIAAGEFISITNSGTSGEVDVRADAYCCSYCMQIFQESFVDLQKMARDHHAACKFRLDVDGMTTITADDLAGSTEEWQCTFDALGCISQRERGLDFPITNCLGIESKGMVVFLYVKEGRVVGFATTADVDLPGQVFGRRAGLRKSLIDFIVLPYLRRQGLGKLIFDHVLRYHHVKPLDLAYYRPSEAMNAFLDKFYSSLEDFILYG